MTPVFIIGAANPSATELPTGPAGATATRQLFEATSFAEAGSATGSV